jgi:hypothetical protein
MHYTGTFKNVVLDDGRKFEAFFPSGHSQVKGIIYRYSRVDRNRGDDWANRSDWVEDILVYVLWKGEREWERIVDGDEDTSAYNISYVERKYIDYKGDLTPIDQILLKMEDKPVKRRYDLLREKKDILSSIEENKRRLKNIEKDLKMIKKDCSHV